MCAIPASLTCEPRGSAEAREWPGGAQRSRLDLVRLNSAMDALRFKQQVGPGTVDPFVPKRSESRPDIRSNRNGFSVGESFGLAPHFLSTEEVVVPRAAWGCNCSNLVSAEPFVQDHLRVLNKAHCIGGPWRTYERHHQPAQHVGGRDNASKYEYPGARHEGQPQVARQDSQVNGGHDQAIARDRIPEPSRAGAAVHAEVTATPAAAAMAASMARVGCCAGGGSDRSSRRASVRLPNATHPASPAPRHGRASGVQPAAPVAPAASIPPTATGIR